LMQVSDEAIRAIVQTAQYSDERAAEWVARCIIERRNKVGRAFLNDVLPLDHFAVRGGKLTFDDLAVRYGFHDARRYTVAWSEFDNATSRKTPIAGTGFDVPRSNGAAYLAADIHAEDPQKTVTVYLRGNEVVGIDRTW
jgi:hypothetical protein